MKEGMSEYKILLVDDDAVCNFITKTLLNQKGFENVQAVENGKEGMEYLAKNEPPNLIFLDLNMPVMDGFEFLAHLTDTSVCPDTSILVLTSSSRKEDVQFATSFGNVIAYLEKPLTEKKVSEVVDGLLNFKPN